MQKVARKGSKEAEGRCGSGKGKGGEGKDRTIGCRRGRGGRAYVGEEEERMKRKILKAKFRKERK